MVDIAAMKRKIRKERQKLFGKRGNGLTPKKASNVEVSKEISTSSEALHMMRIRENPRWMRDDNEPYNDD